MEEEKIDRMMLLILRLLAVFISISIGTMLALFIKVLTI